MLRPTKPRITRYIPLVVAGLAAIVFAVDCTDSTDPTLDAAKTSVSTVAMSLGAPTLTVGQSIHATAVAKNLYGAAMTGQAISWSSLDTMVATVSSSGMVTAVAPGKTTIRAVIDATAADAELTVNPVPVASVTVSLPSSPLTPGQSMQAAAVATDASGDTLTGRTITWASTDSTVVFVSSSGLVTAVSAGTATIQATVDTVVGSAKITVSSPQSAATPIATLSVILPGSGGITVGQIVQATAVAKDSSGNTLTGRAVAWASLNTGVAVVSSTGLVTGMAVGQATIQATVGTMVATLLVNVSAPGGPVATMTVNLASASLSPGQTTQATAVAKDASGNVLTGQPITWSSLSPGVAIASSTGLVTAVTNGQATIQATVGTVSGTAIVTVSAPVAPVATVTVNLTLATLSPGQTTQATAVAKDASGNVLTGRPVAWSSLNTGVATVSSLGLVTAVAVGSATIRATVQNQSGAAAVGNAVVAVAAAAAPPVAPPSGPLPALPLYSVDTHPSDMPSPGTAHHVHSGDDLQAVINAAAPGDSIVLDPGAMFAGNYVLPAKNGASASSWITITTAGVSLPEGTRMTPSMASSSNLAHIRATNTMDGLQAVSGASYYHVSGLELDVDPAASITYSIVEFSPGSQYINADHLYVHGTSTSPIVRGILLNGAWLGVTDSYVSDIHGNNFDSQAIVGWTGPGPYKIVNNYLEAAGENVMFGGSDPTVVGQTPADITIQGNHFYKQLSWGTTWTVKNLFELKDAQRVLVEGNIFENCWAAGQTGYAILMQAVSQQNTAPWSTVADITFRYNYVTNATGGVALNSRTSGQLGLLPTNPSQRILLENNVFDKVGIDPVLGPGTTGNMIMMINDLQNVTIRHNSLIGASGLNAGMMLGVAGLGPLNALVVRDNVYDLGLYGMGGSGTGVGTAALTAYAPGADVQGNVFFAHPTNPAGSWGSPSNYPANNSFANSSTDVGFTSFSTGDYTLSSSSPYRGKATDGLDPGANIATLNSMIAGAR